MVVNKMINELLNKVEDRKTAFMLGCGILRRLRTLNFSHSEGSNSSEVRCFCIRLYIAGKAFSTC